MSGITAFILRHKARIATVAAVVLALGVPVLFLPSALSSGANPAAATTAHAFVPTTVPLPLHDEAESSPTF